MFSSSVDRRSFLGQFGMGSSTIPGIVAHQSALKDGETLKISQFDRPKAS
jgi:hypothetical protein